MRTHDRPKRTLLRYLVTWHGIKSCSVCLLSIFVIYTGPLVFEKIVGLSETEIDLRSGKCFKKRLSSHAPVKSLEKSSWPDTKWQTIVGNKVYTATKYSFFTIQEFGCMLDADLQMFHKVILHYFGKTVKHMTTDYVHRRLNRAAGLEYIIRGRMRHDGKRKGFEARFRNGIGTAECELQVRKFPISLSSIFIVIPYHNSPKRLEVFLQRHKHLTYNSGRKIYFVISILKHSSDQQDVKRISKRMFLNEGRRVEDILYISPNNGDRNGNFSRSVSIRDSVDIIPGASDVVFICDLDILISKSFMLRCDANAILGSQVYFPIIHGLYPYAKPKPIVTGLGGFWRHESFGMVCIRKGDFKKLNIYSDAEERFSGWGKEDSFLFESIQTTDQYVPFRAIDPSLYHVWHLPECDKQIGNENLCKANTFGNLAHPLKMGHALQKLIGNVSELIESLHHQ